MVCHFYNAIVMLKGDRAYMKCMPVGDYMLFNNMYIRGACLTGMIATISVLGRHIYFEAMSYVSVCLIEDQNLLEI